MEPVARFVEQFNRKWRELISSRNSEDETESQQPNGTAITKSDDEVNGTNGVEDVNDDDDDDDDEDAAKDAAKKNGKKRRR